MNRMSRTLVLFNYDFDAIGFARHATRFPVDAAGFDLFSFPSNARLAFFDLERFTARLAARAAKRGWNAVTSHQEQFGALAAALLAERMGWPGTPVDAVLACQHKLHARQVLQACAPEANPAFALLPVRYGEPVPQGLAYPCFVKPVKAAFSVLARTVRSRDELAAMTRFGRGELWVIRHLVEPFERIARQRLSQAGTAHRLLIEAPMHGRQFNLDGYVFGGRMQALGIVESEMYPGTQAFMRFAYPCVLPDAVRARAADVARRFLDAVGFTHGLFNMEFFYDAADDRLGVIEFNPRMASQFSDLYLRVDGVDLHRIALALAHGDDPAGLPRAAPVAGAAASVVFRSFDRAARIAMPGVATRAALARAMPDALLFRFEKSAGAIARDCKWLDSYRYGILHLGGADVDALRQRCESACAMLGWAGPWQVEPVHAAAAGAPARLSLETS